jgi:hypothetical protein
MYSVKMRKNDEVLTQFQLAELIHSGFEPEFRSLAGILKDASALGARKAYDDLIRANRISARSTYCYEMISSMAMLDRADDLRLMDAALDSTMNAIQYAARLGYNRMYDKFK